LCIYDGVNRHLERNSDMSIASLSTAFLVAAGYSYTFLNLGNPLYTTGPMLGIAGAGFIKLFNTWFEKRKGIARILLLQSGDAGKPHETLQITYANGKQIEV